MSFATFCLFLALWVVITAAGAVAALAVQSIVLRVSAKPTNTFNAR